MNTHAMDDSDEKGWRFATEATAPGHDFDVGSCECGATHTVDLIAPQRRPMTDVEIAERDRAIANFPGGLVLSPEEADELRSNTVRVRE